MLKHFSKGLIFSLLLCTSPIVHANTVSAEDARQLATEFFQASSLDRLASQDALELVFTCGQADRPLYYVFNARDRKGFIIMSADDCAAPVLGYSTESTYNSAALPPAMKWMMQGLENEIKAAPGIQQPFARETRRMMVRKSAGSNQRILLETPQWRQEAPFNNMIPGNPLTGCVGTAMAMIMKYHNYPEKGTGSYNGVNYEVAYDWDNMRMDNYRYGYTQAEADAVATLVYHAASSIGTQFGYSGSSAYEVKVPAALINYFSYDPGVSYKKRSEAANQAEFDLIVENEIRAGRPVLYCGQDVTAGHAFVVDGFDPLSNMIHVNWGWGGSDGNNNGGWYASTALNPTVSQTHSFNNLTTIIYNIKPGDGNNTAWSPLHITADGRQIGMSSNLSGDLTPGKEFTVRVGNIKNVSYNNFSGMIAVALFAADGTFKATLSKPDGFHLNGMDIFGSSYADFSCSLPSVTEVADGDIIRMATLADGATEWLPIPGELVTNNEIPAKGAVPQYFSVAYPASLGDASFTGDNKVIRGWNYNFRVVPSYPDRDVVTVRNNGYVLTPGSNYSYSIKNVLEDQNIEIFIQNAADVKEKRSIWVGTPGSLSSILDGPDAATVKDLTLFGTIDERDFTFIRSSMKLTRLDLSGVRITANGSNQANAVPREAFRNLWSLKEVILPSSVNRINNGAFRSCGITSIVIPASVNTYEINAFNGSSGLRDIWVLNPNPSYVSWCVFYGTPSNRTVHCPNEASAAKYKADKYWNQPDVDTKVQFVAGTPEPTNDYAFALMENNEVKYISDTTPGRYEKGKKITFTAEHIVDNDNRMEVYANSTLLKPDADGNYTVTLNTNTIVHFDIIEPTAPSPYSSDWKLTDTGGTVGLITDAVNVLPGIPFTVRANSFSVTENYAWAFVLTTADGKIKEFISPVCTWTSGSGTGFKMNVNCCVKEASVREGNLIRMATTFNFKTWQLVDGINENVIDRLPAINNQTPVYNFTFTEGIEEKANIAGRVESAVRGRDLTFKISPKSATDVVSVSINGTPVASNAKSYNYSFIAKENLVFDIKVTTPSNVHEVVFDLTDGKRLYNPYAGIFDEDSYRNRSMAMKDKTHVIIKGNIDKTDFDLFKNTYFLSMVKTIRSIDLTQAVIVADRSTPDTYPADQFPAEAFQNSATGDGLVKTLKELKFPAGTKSIATNALYGCSGITEIELPLHLYNNENVNNLSHTGGLRQNCFSGCTNLTTIYCYATPAGGNTDMVHHIDFNGYHTSGSGHDINNPSLYPNTLSPTDPSKVTVVVKPEYFTQYSTPKNTGSGGWINGWKVNNFNIVYDYPVYGIDYDVNRCFVTDKTLDITKAVSFLKDNIPFESIDFAGRLYIAAGSNISAVDGRPDNVDPYNPECKVKVYDNGNLLPADKINSDGSVTVTFYNPNNIKYKDLVGNHKIDVVYLYDINFNCTSTDLSIEPIVNNNENKGDKATFFEVWNSAATRLENIRENSTARFKVNLDNINSAEIDAVVKIGETTLTPDEDGYYNIEINDADMDVTVYAVPRNGATLTAADIECINASEASEITTISFAGDFDSDKLVQVIDEFPRLEEVDLSKLTVALPAEAMAGNETLRTVVLPHATDIEDGTFDGCVNLTSVSVPSTVDYIGNNAFNGCSSLESLSFTGIKSIGDNAFSGCDNLTTIIFNSPQATTAARARRVARTPRAEGISDDAFNGLNPNCLIYLDENEAVPQGIAANYIKVSTIDSNTGKERVYRATGSIALNAGYPFNALNSFTIPEGNDISVELDLLASDGMSAWRSLLLPFEPARVTDASGNDMIIFENTEAIPVAGKNYMAATICNEEATLSLSDKIKANTPYIVATHFNTKAGKVRFAAQDITVDRTPDEIRCKGEGYDMLGTFGKRQLNAATTYRLNSKGSSFVAGDQSSYAADDNESAEYAEVEPFSVYIEAPENSQPLDIDIPIKDLSGINDISVPSTGLRIIRDGDTLIINSDCDCEIKVFDVNGILVKVLHLSAGANTCDGLPAGIYILNGVKTIL